MAKDLLTRNDPALPRPFYVRLKDRVPYLRSGEGPICSGFCLEYNGGMTPTSRNRRPKSILTRDGISPFVRRAREAITRRGYSQRTVYDASSLEIPDAPGIFVVFAQNRDVPVTAVFVALESLRGEMAEVLDRRSLIPTEVAVLPRRIVDGETAAWHRLRLAAEQADIVDALRTL